MRMEQTECCETLAYEIQTSGNYPEESIQHSEHGESVKSRITILNLVDIVLLTQYCAGGKIETNEMGRACGTYGGG